MVTSGNVEVVLAQLLEKLRDKQPVLKAAGRIVQQSIKRNFAESGRPEKWAKLKRPSKKRGGKSAKPLVDTGRLMNSFTSGGDSAYELKEGELDAGTNVEYAKYHDPFRPFMVVQDEDIEDIEEFIQDYYTK